MIVAKSIAAIVLRTRYFCPSFALKSRKRFTRLHKSIGESSALAIKYISSPYMFDIRLGYHLVRTFVIRWGDRRFCYWAIVTAASAIHSRESRWVINFTVSLGSRLPWFQRRKWPLFGFSVTKHFVSLRHLRNPRYYGLRRRNRHLR